MTKVIFITQQFDPEDPQIAIVVPQVAAIARRVGEVVVIADRIVADALPPNGRAYSFHAATKLGRGLRVLAAVARELPGMRKGGGMVIAHMVPLYAIIAAPLVRPARVPLVMWWSHWKMDRVVRLGERVSTRVVSVGPGTFPLASRKLVTVGQAIDVESFPPRASTREPGPLRIVVIGRYSAAKGIGTIVRAAGIALSHGADIRLDVYGPALTPDSRVEHESLQALVRDLDLSERVQIHGSVNRAEVVRLLGEADVLVNNAPGGADRIVYEAAAAGIPVLASNPAHTNLLEPDAFYNRDDPEQLASLIEALARRAPAERDELGRSLRERVAREHSVESWSAGLLRAGGLTTP
ncbi:MAG TPA: glycosyltransferase family 4 protein [Gaiellaceae bacterium]|nr:glycosyltransferase family 4 protein [Gaiellaceae bacterium]